MIYDTLNWLIGLTIALFLFGLGVIVVFGIVGSILAAAEWALRMVCDGFVWLKDKLVASRMGNSGE